MIPWRTVYHGHNQVQVAHSEWSLEEPTAAEHEKESQGLQSSCQSHPQDLWQQE